MRDLYKRLGVEKDCGYQELIKAVSCCKNNNIKEDASFILLHKGRKQKYDCLNDALKSIGELRSSIGLSYTERWKDSLAEEYSSSPKKSGTELLSLRKRVAKLDSIRKRESISSAFKVLVGRLLLVSSIAFAAYSYFSYEAGKYRGDSGGLSTSSSNENVGVSNSDHSHPSDNYALLELPRNGVVEKFTTDKAVAPLEILASSEQNFYVKLKDVDRSLADVMSIFVRKGEVANVSVPLGDYQLFYAAGDQWYGVKNMFGDNTNYSKADDVFSFKVEDGYISGYTVELRLMRDGNLSTSRIDEDSF